MPKIYHKECEFCGTFYESSAKKFCSLKCSQLYSSKHPNKGCFYKGHNRTSVKPSVWRNCLSCNKLFEVPKSNPKTKYCCHKCSTEHLFKGKKLSEEHKTKVRLNHSHYWSHHMMSKEHIEKMTIGFKNYQSGENHWNWKGGITPLLRKLRFGNKYYKWRKEVFIRDKWKCLECGQVGGRLQAHHIIPFSELVYNKDWKTLWNIDNGRTLCIKCHIQTDSYAKRFKRKY